MHMKRQISRRNISLTSAYVSQARIQCEGNSDLEIDDDPSVSLSEGGAWVAAWIWVDCDAIVSKGMNLTRAPKARNQPAKFRA